MNEWYTFTSWKFARLCVPFTLTETPWITVGTFRCLAVQKLGHQNRGQIFSRYGRKFDRRKVKTIIVSLYSKLDRRGMYTVPSKFLYGKACLHNCVATQLEDVILDSFSSPEPPLGLICRLWTQRKIRSFYWLKAIECAHQIKNTMFCAQHYTSCPPEL